MENVILHPVSPLNFAESRVTHQACLSSFLRRKYTYWHVTCVYINCRISRFPPPPPSKVRILSKTLGKNRIFFEATQTHMQREGDTKNFTAIWDFRGHLLQDWGPLTNTILYIQLTLKNRCSVSFKAVSLKNKIECVHYWVLFMNKFFASTKNRREVPLFCLFSKWALTLRFRFLLICADLPVDVPRRL